MTPATLFDYLEEEAHARATDPETSHAAARTVDVTKGQKVVLAEFRMYTRMTDEELIEALRIRATSCPDAKISDSGARSRRAELVRKGYVVDSGVRKHTAAGRSTVVWQLA